MRNDAGEERAVKFSLYLSTGFEGVMYAVPFAGPRDLAAETRLCERLGNCAGKLFHGRPPTLYEPMIVLSTIAAAMTKFGTALAVLPMATQSIFGKPRRTSRSKGSLPRP
jgi:hypothetical protein